MSEVFRRRSGALALAVVLMVGCVKEELQPARGGGEATRGARAPGDGGGADLGSGPIAAPAVRASKTLTRVRVAVKPMGTVPYDGQVLPMISPDGLSLATQVGEAPSWEALLGQQLPAGQGLSTRVEIYDLRQSPATLRATAGQSAEGVMLARGVDDRGVLVEGIDDAGRWRIGRAAWDDGRIEWLTTGEAGRGAASGQACLSATGDLYYSEPDEIGRRRLVMIDARGARSEISETGASLLYPVATDDAGVVYAVSQRMGAAGGGSGAGSLELVAYRVRESSTQQGARTLGAAIARRKLASEGDPMIAYQALGACGAPMPVAQGQESPHGSGGASGGLDVRDPLVFFSPAGKRMAVFDPSVGMLATLAPGSFAAVPWADGESRGYLCSTKDGVVFDPLDTRDQATRAEARTTARVVSTASVPRRTRHTQTPIFLLGPVAGDPQRLSVTGLAASAEE